MNAAWVKRSRSVVHYPWGIELNIVIKRRLDNLTGPLSKQA